MNAATETIRRTLFCGLIALSALASRAGVRVDILELDDSPVARGRYGALPFRLWEKGKYRPDSEERAIILTLSNSRCVYSFSLRGNAEVTGVSKSSLGMPGPSGANWYSGSFLTFRCDGVSISDCVVSVIGSFGDERRGGFALRYEAPGFAALLEISMLEADSRVLMGFLPEKLPPGADSYRLELLCYPSSFGGGSEKGRDIRERQARTSGRTLDIGRHSLKPDEPWVYLYDRWFDPEQNRGDGPCAALYNPWSVKGAEVQVGNYACRVGLEYPATKEGWVMLWDFAGYSNAGALDYMESLEVSQTSR